MEVKIFESIMARDLEDKVNSFLERVDVKLSSIQYSTCGTGHTIVYSAIVVYRKII